MRTNRASDIRHRLVSIAIICAVLLAGILVQSLGTWSPSSYGVVPGSSDIFPTVDYERDAIVVDVPADADHGLMLALTSLQGLVNRNRSRVYMDFKGSGNMSFMLPFIVGRYGVNTTRVSPQDFLRDYSTVAANIVVYDPSRPDTINVATVEAGLNDYIIAEPSWVEEIRALTGLDIAIDLRIGEWAGLDAAGMYRKSFREHYPRSSNVTLGILPPAKLGLRDYLVAARVWTFYSRQGPFASPSEMDLTEEFLASTPHNIPVLGWFETPTLIEENFFVQVASRHGKSILGGQDVPNLSFYCGITLPQPFMQKRTVPPTPTPKEDGVYVTFAVPDGDNLDFIATKMHEMWDEDVRGSIPIAWSINPLLTRLAPPVIDYYYFGATGLDSFIAAPSGAGYLYPDFTVGNDLDQYLVRSKRFMAAADLDVVWLLNSFKAYEIPYSEQTLERYVTSLAPKGIVLDYADQAATRDVWMAGGQGAASPVIRSTHLWSGMENLVGKVMMDVDASPGRPHFFLVVVYPWSLSLGDAVEAFDVLLSRYGPRVNAVSIENMFSMIEEAFLVESRRTVSDTGCQPLATLDFWDMDAARGHLAVAEDYASRGETSLAGFYSYLAMERAKRALATGLVIFLAIIAVSLLVALLIVKRYLVGSKDRVVPTDSRWILPGVAVASLFYLFFAGLQRALDYNFWTYVSVLVAGVAIFLGSRVQRRMELMARFNVWPLEVSILAVSSLLLLYEPWAFVPFALATATLLFRFMNLQDVGRRRDALYFGLGLGASVVFPLGGFSLSLPIIVVTIVAFRLKPEVPAKPVDGRRTRGVTFAATALAVSSIWIALYQNRYFVERTGGGLDLLHGLAVISLVVAPVVALVAWRVLPSRYRLDSLMALSGSVVLWITLWFIQNIFILVVLIMMIAIALSWGFLSASSRVNWSSGGTTKYVSVLLILSTVVFVLIRMPAIVYSLYIVKLPLAAEYVLYTPPLLMIFVTLDIVQTEALYRVTKKRTRN